MLAVDAAVSGSSRACPRATASRNSDRTGNRHTERGSAGRCASTLAAGISRRDDQEAAHEVDHLGAALVPARLDQCALASRARRDPSGTNGPMAEGELGPVYGRQWRAWPTPDGQTIDPGSPLFVEAIKTNPDFAPPYRQRLERRRYPQDEVGRPATRLFQFLGRRRAPLLPTLINASGDIFSRAWPFNIASLRVY